jgi:ABC-type phosphate/phosphonate transport system permease subunit
MVTLEMALWGTLLAFIVDSLAYFAAANYAPNLPTASRRPSACFAFRNW